MLYSLICLLAFEKKFINRIQIVLDIVGFIPGFGEPADGINALIYLASGDKTNAALSGVSVLPFLGIAGTVGKWLNKVSDTADIIEDATPSQLTANVVEEPNHLLKLDLQYFADKGTGTPSKPLLAFLEENGIKYKIHD